MLRISSAPFLNRCQDQLKTVKTAIVKFYRREKFIWELKIESLGVKIGLVKLTELKSVDDLDNL